MEELTREAKVIYNLLKHGLAEDLDKRLQNYLDGVIQAIGKLLHENTTRLDGLFATRMGQVRDKLSGVSLFF